MISRALLLALAAIGLSACQQSVAQGSRYTSPQRLIAAEAARQGVPEPLALRISRVESGDRCDAVGSGRAGRRPQGPLQILPGSARALGHRGGPLNNCEAGLVIGMRHLAMCFRLAKGDHALTARCHVAGPGGMKRRGRYATAYVRRAMR
jgi:soluble lytic murein transglycosylase-like protein